MLKSLTSDQLDNLNQIAIRRYQALEELIARFEGESVLGPVLTILDRFAQNKKRHMKLLCLLCCDMVKRRRAIAQWTDLEWLDTFSTAHEQGVLSNIAVVALHLSSFSSFHKLQSLNRKSDLAETYFSSSEIENELRWIDTKRIDFGYSGCMNSDIKAAYYYVLLNERKILAECPFLAVKNVMLESCTGAAKGASLLGKVCFAEGINHRVRIHTKNISSVTTNVSREWVEEIEGWHAAVEGNRTTKYSYRKCVFAFARWLTEKYPNCLSSTAVTEDIAFAARKMILAAKVGEWKSRGADDPQKNGQPLSASSKKGWLFALKKYFLDQEERGMELSFEPRLCFRVSGDLYSKLGPNPLRIDDAIWQSIINGAVGIEEQDFPAKSLEKYPFEMIRAITLLYVFSGCRISEIARLRLDCLRYLEPGEFGLEDEMHYLIVPMQKSAGYKKEILSFVAEAIEDWKRVRRPHKKMWDPVSSTMEYFLFSHRATQVSKLFFGRSILPILLAKAGLAKSDSKGDITARRFRTSMAHDLLDENGGDMTFSEVQRWLGHQSVRSTEYYIPRLNYEDIDKQLPQSETGEYIAMLGG